MNDFKWRHCQGEIILCGTLFANTASASAIWRDARERVFRSITPPLSFGSNAMHQRSRSGHNGICSNDPQNLYS